MLGDRPVRKRDEHLSKTKGRRDKSLETGGTEKLKASSKVSGIVSRQKLGKEEVGDSKGWRAPADGSDIKDKRDKSHSKTVANPVALSKLKAEKGSSRHQKVGVGNGRNDTLLKRDKHHSYEGRAKHGSNLQNISQGRDDTLLKSDKHHGDGGRIKHGNKPQKIVKKQTFVEKSSRVDVNKVTSHAIDKIKSFSKLNDPNKLDERIASLLVFGAEEKIVHSNITEENGSTGLKRSDTFDLSVKDAFSEEVTNNEQQDPDDDGNVYLYDEDFEEYDDDFEDGDEEEDQAALGYTEVVSDSYASEEESNSNAELKLSSVELQDPMELGTIPVLNQDKNLNNVWENSEVLPPQKIEAPEALSDHLFTTEQSSTASPYTYINFSQCIEMKNALDLAKKCRTRGNKLLQLLTLDSVSFHLFEMRPTHYDMFMQVFGKSKTKQASTETGLDCSEVEIQTMDLQTVDKWTQHPPDGCQVTGGHEPSKDKEMRVDNISRLLKFLKMASQTIEMLLVEELVNGHGRDLNCEQSTTEFSSEVLRLEPPSFRRNCPVNVIHCSNFQPDLLLSIHDCLSDESECVLESEGIICVWNLHISTKPVRILICPSKPTSCCFGLVNCSTVVAGAFDGAVLLWNLNDNDGQHLPYYHSGVNWLLSPPAYNTAALRDYVSAHHSPVIAIHLLTNPDSQGHSNVASNIGSLEEAAVLIIWVCMKLAKQSGTCSTSDLGLAPDGNMTLIPSTQVNLNSLMPDSFNMRVCDFAISPSDVNNFFIGTDVGAVLNFRLHQTVTKLYRHDPDIPVDVASIHFNPHGRPCFLVAYIDGCVALHSMTSEKPLISWSKAANGAPILCVRWSQNSQHIFYLLDAFGNVHLWDLTQSDLYPVISTSPQDGSFSCIGIGSDSRIAGKKHCTFWPYLVLGTTQGLIEVHYLKQKFTRIGNEDGMLDLYLSLI